MFQRDESSGEWAYAPVAGRFGDQVAISGSTALASASELQNRGAVHRYEFDAQAQRWQYVPLGGHTARTVPRASSWCGVRL